MKKRILFVNEASYLTTGFSVYGLEILNRLHNTDKYELAEFGIYAEDNDNRWRSLPWKFFPNQPSNEAELQTYNAHPTNQFGEWRFEKTCLQFKPHVVCIPPGKLVMTNYGHKPIEDIKIGDAVLTHNNRFKKVTNVMRRQYNGNIYHIYFNCCSTPLSVTEEHPVFILQNKKQTYRKKSIALIYEDETPKFVPANKIKVGDLIVLPSNKSDNLTILTAFLKKWVGCYKKNTVSFCTIDKILAYDYRMLCTSIGIPTSLHYYNNHYEVEGYGESAKLLHDITQKHDTLLQRNNVHKTCKRAQIVNNYLISSIRRIRILPYTGQVYNLEVEKDNSYVTQQACVHNCDVRDPWMCEFEERSPFRPFFKWAIMPTVDSAPQDDSWIASYLNADSVYTYSEFGLETLSRQGGGLIKLHGIASPGVNLSEFPFVIDRRAHKKSLGMPDDTFVIGTVMRNQERKLYPDLIEAFGMFLKQAPAELAKKSFLYLHTMYPDVGWNIPRLLKEEGLVNKTLFTYICQQCKSIFPSFYQDARTYCRNCGSYSTTLPGIQGGITREVLGKILNIFDAYVQYSSCEGFGIPLVEAAACGTPIFAVDYSASSDIIKKLDGVPIKVQRMFYEPKTHTKRALPDNQDLVNKLLIMAALPKEERIKIGQNLRIGVKENYCWDKTSKKWEECFDSIEVLSDEQSWSSPGRITQPNMQCPQNMTNDEFVQWAIINIAGRPELLNSYISLRLTRDLNWGASQVRPGGYLSSDISFSETHPKWAAYDRNNVVQEMIKACEQKNVWEQQRLGGLYDR